MWLCSVKEGTKMLKRQNQIETNEKVSMYANEGYIPTPSYYDCLNSTFAYRPGQYGDAYDQNMANACDGALYLLFGWLL